MQSNIFCTGLFAKTWNLHPLPKKELIALIDFESFGYGFREMDLVRFLYSEICSCLDLNRISNQNIFAFLEGYIEKKLNHPFSLKTFHLLVLANMIRALSGYIDSGKYFEKSDLFDEALESRIKRLKFYALESKCLN